MGMRFRSGAERVASLGESQAGSLATLTVGGALVVLVLALLAPAQAVAGRVEAFVHQPGPGLYDFGFTRVTYTAGPGEVNRLSIGVSGEVVTVSDPAGVVPGRDCERGSPPSSTVAVCSARYTPGLVASLGDMDDSLATAGVTSDNGYGVGGVYAYGGAGKDSLAAAPGGRLDGGRGNDRLRGGSGQTTFIGGPGDDRMIGGSADDLFESDASRDGRDTMVGGTGSGDIVSYALRHRAIRADLAGDRDDGARGERDLVTRSVEGLVGGFRNDRLVGDRRANSLSGGSGGRDRLYGHGGDDSLSGGPGGDRLSAGSGRDLVNGGPGGDVILAGPGRDRIFGYGGPDRMYLRDGEFDEIRCGRGRDRLWVDQFDFFSPLLESRSGPNHARSSCERVRRSRPPTAIFLDVDRVRVSEHGPTALPLVGCPGDMGRSCHGRIAFRIGRRGVGYGAFRLEATEQALVRIGIDRDVWERARDKLRGLRATMFLRLRDKRGNVVRRSHRVWFGREGGVFLALPRPR